MISCAVAPRALQHYRRKKKTASRQSFIPSYLCSRLCCCLLSLPAPAEQTYSTEAGGEEWEGGKTANPKRQIAIETYDVSTLPQVCPENLMLSSRNQIQRTALFLVDVSSTAQSLPKHLRLLSKREGAQAIARSEAV